MLARKDEVVKGLTGGVRGLFKKNKIASFQGTGRLASPTSVVVRGDDGTETTLEAGHILLATGSEPIDLPFLPFDGKTIVGSTEALGFDRVPEHLIVVGGGYIGLELGSVWKRLGRRSRSSSSSPGSSRSPTSRSARSCTRAWSSRGSNSTSRPRSPARRSRGIA